MITQELYKLGFRNRLPLAVTWQQDASRAIGRPRGRIARVPDYEYHPRVDYFELSPARRLAGVFCDRHEPEKAPPSQYNWLFGPSR
jgi:hypothetical protein